MVCLVGGQEEKTVFGKVQVFFTSFLIFLTFLVGILFLEPDSLGVRVYFVAFSIRWFVL